MKKYKIPSILILLAFVFISIGIMGLSPIYRWRPYPTDTTCKLHLPFYKYGAEQSKIWDISGNNNHGTITGAVPYPGNPVMTNVGSTYNYGDYTSDNAFFWSSLDLSPCKGTDTGSTPFRIEVTDGAGKKATGYIGAIGAGETLGSELITGWTNHAGYPYSTLTTTGKDIDSAIDLAGDVGIAYQVYISTIGQLLKNVHNVTLNSGELPDFYFTQTSTGGVPQIIVDLSAGVNTFYKTMKDVYYDILFFNALAPNYSSVNSMKRVTDCPTTAIHIVSSLNGTTRNWESIDSGFDPNDIASWKIDKVIPTESIGWQFDAVDDKITITDFADVGNSNQEITVIIWLKNRGYVSGKTLFAHYDTGANQRCWSINQISGPKYRFYLSSDGTALDKSYICNLGLISFFNFQCVGFTFNAGTLSLYLNGVLDSAPTKTTDTIIATLHDSTANLTVGCSLNSGATSFPYKMVAGEVLIFNRALSAQEMRNYYELTRRRYGV